MMKIAIVGSRTFHNYDLLETELLNFMQNQVIEVTEIISGGAIGTDTLAYRFAKECGITIRVIFPKWQEQGKLAGFQRNLKIVRECDVLFAFWDGQSRGTKHSIDTANGLGREVHIVRV